MNKTIVITGASDGIGAAAARRLRQSGHTIAVVGRDPKKTLAVANELDAEHFVADFESFAEVGRLATELAKTYGRIDVLANNAGGIFGDRTKTIDGFEKTIQINHLAPFLLTNLLMDTLISSRASIIQTSSVAARLYGKLDVNDLDNDLNYSANRAYGNAKLANILFTRELAKRFGSQGVSAAAFHPGVISTNFASQTTSGGMRLVYNNPIAKRFFGTPEKGADQLVWLAETDPGSSWESGAYYERRKIASRVNPQVTDDKLAADLWEHSARAVATTNPI